MPCQRPLIIRSRAGIITKARVPPRFILPPPPSSPGQWKMLPNCALWPSTMPCPHLPSQLYSKITTGPLVPWRTERVLHQLRPVSYLVSPACSFGWFHNPAVSGRKECHINYSSDSCWDPLALEFGVAADNPISAPCSWPPRISCHCFNRTSSNNVPPDWSFVSRLYLYFRSLKPCRNR